MEKKNEQEPQELITVPFYGDTLFVIDRDGVPYAPVRPIVENLGLAWQPQHKKLTSHADRWGVTIMVTPSVNGQGGVQKTICLPISKLPAWLYSVDARKVKPELRGKISLYQEECDEALWSYWTEGVAKRKSAAESARVEELPQPEELPLPALPTELQARIDRRAWEMAQPYFAEFKRDMERNLLIRQGALAPDEFKWEGHWHHYMEKAKMFAYSIHAKHGGLVPAGKQPEYPDPLAVILAQAINHAWFDGRRYGEIPAQIRPLLPREFTMEEIEAINHKFAAYLPWAEKLVQRIRQSGQPPLASLEDCRMISLRKAAELTGMTYDWWYRAMSGNPVLPIRAYRFGRAIRIHQGDLVAWVNKGKPYRRQKPADIVPLPTRKTLLGNPGKG